MADPPRNHTRDTAMETAQGSPTGTSRWQKVVGILGLVVVLWVGNQMLGTIFGGGPGGPGGPGGHGPDTSEPAQWDH